MNSKSGKGYFYAMGQRDKSLYDYGGVFAHPSHAGSWPVWARYAYYCGLNNLAP